MDDEYENNLKVEGLAFFESKKNYRDALIDLYVMIKKVSDNLDDALTEMANLENRIEDLE